MIFRSPFPDVAIPDNVALTPFILRRAGELKDKPAMIDGPSGRTLTYGQLAVLTQRVATGLAQRGLRKGDVFAIYSPNVPEYFLAFHGVASAGGIVTTVNPLYTVGELTHQLLDANAKFLLTIPHFLANALEAAKAANIQEVFVFGEAEGATPFAALLQNNGDLPPVPINPKEDLVVLPYSSGTTGLPKGVMLTHYNLIANVCQADGILVDKLRVREDEVVIGLLPFYHIYGMVVILNANLYMGATVVTLPRFDLEQFLQTFEKYGVTYANLVPPIILALAKHPLVDKYNLAKLRHIASGAAPLSTDLARAASARLHCVVNQGYGLTETSPVSHYGVDPALGLEGSVGPAIPNTESKVVDVATGAELGPNQEGEVCIRGPQVMKGYLNRPDATAAMIDRNGWLHTGDIGYADEQGNFYIVDRLKELIKYKGMQVAPAELEGVLLTHPAVADVAVIGVADEEAGEIPKAFVVRKANVGDTVTADEIMSYVAGRVAPHKKIRRLEFVEAIPKSASGKILRRLLVEKERAR